MSDLYNLNARIRAMWGRLLTRSDYDKLLASAGLPEIAAALRETPYGFFIESVGRGISDAGRMEEALRRNFEVTLSRLLSISGGDCREAVRLLLGSWEVQAVKTVLRGKAAGIPPEDILASLLPTGIHGEAALQEMCRQPNLRAVVDLLATWRDPWGGPLFRAMKDYREQKDLYVLEAALDRFRAEQAASLLRGIRRPHRGDEREDALALFLALSVDRANLMTALKAVEEKIPLADRRAFFLKGGLIFAERDFDRILSSRSVADALVYSARSLFSRALGTMPASFAGFSLLTSVERQLDRVLLKVMRARMRSDPLGWGMPASFLLNKTREIQNLRMIFRARMTGLPDPDLMELLILDY